MPPDDKTANAFQRSLFDIPVSVLNATNTDPRKSIAFMRGETQSADYLSQPSDTLTSFDSMDLHSPTLGEARPFRLVMGEAIGLGGMAQINSATQCSLGREIAVKRPRKDRHSKHVNNAMIQEAQMLSKLDHPNILPVYELALDEDGQPIILMKRVHGISWSTLLHNPEHEFWNQRIETKLESHLKILIQVCHALEYAHSKGIIHRDVKTENVMVGDFGETYLLDWGLAVEMDEREQYKAEGFCGTPCFAAPEMFSYSQPLSAATDVYLLGGALHEILTLKPLHTGQTLDEITQQAGRSEKRLSNPDVNVMLAEIINRATSHHATERHPGVHEFRASIEEYMKMSRALNLLSKAQVYLEQLEELLSQLEQDSFLFHQLAFEARFTFSQVMEIAPRLEGATNGLTRVLETQLLYELEFGRTEAPRRILKILSQMKLGTDRLNALQSKINTVEVKLQKSGELATQIQYRLMEQLQKQSGIHPDETKTS